ncbi:hypothetical protein H0E87_005930 [Populus deltoides]|uniref:Uncharacterized protein n=1 Tax=Populus deltoides TaxID=3696 RepID=A0A8T2Z544_POPDE|nr:hypothetical protein H0E87_005930 [Populus deltoides]
MKTSRARGWDPPHASLNIHNRGWDPESLPKEKSKKQKPETPFSQLTYFNGSHKANSKKIHRRKSPKEAASHQGSQEVSSSHRRSEEAPPFQARNSGAERNQEVPVEHRAVDKEAAISKAGEGNSPRFQDRLEVPKQCCSSPSRGSRGIPCWVV